MNKNDLIQTVIKPIEEKGGKAYFVGGCVRDKLLGKEPNDYDIVTNFTPEQLHKVFKKFSNVSTNAEQFGVTMPLVKVGDNFEEVEIATFRKDITKGRHPEVSLEATIEEDAARRDFTINALYEDKDGNIIDPTGNGKIDIKTKILRFVGNPVDRLSEDPLRAYRFMRFLAKGFDSPYSVEQLKEFSKVIDFKGVSKERKLKEIKKTFSSKNFLPKSSSFIAGKALGIFEDIGLEKIFQDMENTKQSYKWHAEGSLVEEINDGNVYRGENVKDFSCMKPYSQGTVLNHTLNVLSEMNKIIFEDAAIEITKVDFEDEEKRFLLILSAILHDIGKPYCNEGMKHNTFTWGKNTYEEEVPKVTSHAIIGVTYAEEFCKNLGMSNDEIKFVTTLVANHMEAHKFREHKHKFKILEFVHQPLFKEIMLLAQADDRGSIATVENTMSTPEQTLSDPVVIEMINTPMPKPILTGKDLIDYGLKPNPLFSKMLRVALIHQFEQNETDKKRLFHFVKNIKE